MNDITIKKLPTNWPFDRRSRRADRDGKIILTHPEREPHVYDPATERWTAEPDATLRRA